MAVAAEETAILDLAIRIAIDLKKGAKDGKKAKEILGDAQLIADAEVILVNAANIPADVKSNSVADLGQVIGQVVGGVQAYLAA